MHREAALHRQRFLGILPKLNVVGSIPITRSIATRSGLAPGGDGLGGPEKRPGLFERRVVPDRIEGKAGEARGGGPGRGSGGEAGRRGCPWGRREASATSRAASRAWPTVRAKRRAPAWSTVVSGTRESQAAACRTASEALRTAEPSGPPAPARHRETSRSTGASPPTFVSARRRSRARTFVVPSQSGRT